MSNGKGDDVGWGEPPPVFLKSPRHDTNGVLAGPDPKPPRWRMLEKMKTVGVGLVLCMNIGVSPPDMQKVSPYARMECWIDPRSLSSSKAGEAVSKNLQEQYKRWQAKAKYICKLDPTVEEIKKLCFALRRHARDERVLIHYNGHGVPLPTPNGEVWVFNKNFTQYIPLSLYDLQTWLQSPNIYVFDCNSAGRIIHAFSQFADQHTDYVRQLGVPPPQPLMPGKNSILLAACRGDDTLPVKKELPADLFTSCLTTPITTAIHFWKLEHSQLVDLPESTLDAIPGRLPDRRTPLGELNWIFTAVTDTIAWNVLKPELFQRLFRQDLLVASLFRNFLLADRVMRKYGCVPMSLPELPSAHAHPMWSAWDLAIDRCLCQLPMFQTISYEHSSFFAEQLTAFEVWLVKGSASHFSPNSDTDESLTSIIRHSQMNRHLAPEQLPVVLQVLLSQHHRLRALVLLGRYLDRGPDAVNRGLTVGIFPYVLRLLQSRSPELREVLLFVWAKLLSLDRSCQSDLIKDGGHRYFINVISTKPSPPTEQLILAMVVLCVVCSSFHNGQRACLIAGLMPATLRHLLDSDPMLKRWTCMCLAKLWENHEDAKWTAYHDNVVGQVCQLLSDSSPEVRATAIYAISTFIGGATGIGQRRDVEEKLAVTLFPRVEDSSPLVRKELLCFIYTLIHTYPHDFILLGTDVKKHLADPNMETETHTESTTFKEVLVLLITLASDPYPEVARRACAMANSISSPETASKIQGNDDFLTHTLAETTSMTGLPQSTSSGLRKTQSSMDIAALSAVDVEDGDSPVPSPTTPLLPELHSSLFEWSLARIRQPLLHPVHPTQSGTSLPINIGLLPYADPTGPQSVNTEWKQRRNRAVFEQGKRERKDANRLAFKAQVAILDNEKQVYSALFHPYEPLLFASDPSGGVSVWKWREATKLNSFSGIGQMTTPVKATSMKLVNEEHDALLLVGSEDGIVRIWDDYTERGSERIVTSWRAMPDMRDRDVLGPGMVLDWQQRTGILLAGGDADVVHVWDVTCEYQVDVVQIDDQSSVTAMTSSNDGQLVMMGCSDGAIRIYDRRVGVYAPVVSYHEHMNWIVGVHMCVGDELVSASTAGDVRFWDIRRPASTMTLPISVNTTAFVAHSHGRVMAHGSRDQFILVSNFAGEELSTVLYHEGFLGVRMGPVSTMAFHPHRMLLAAGSTDSILSVYASDAAKVSRI